MQFSRFSFFVLLPAAILITFHTCIYYSLKRPFTWKSFLMNFGSFSLYAIVYIFGFGHPMLVNSYAILSRAPALELTAHRGGAFHGPE